MLFRLKQRLTKPPIPLDIGGVRVKPSSRARRFSLRVDAKAGDVVFTWPLKSRVSLERAQRFVETHRGWIEDQRRKSADAIPFAPGATLHIAGAPCVIEHAPGRGLTRLEEGRIVVHGQPEHLPRRVKDFLKNEAMRALKRLSDEKASTLGLPPAPVRILDPKTRWGSCGPDGKLMYSWRLLLAPPEVMDYVVAHEVAHRVHLNHSRRFWALCAGLTADAAASRRWLRQNGRRLLAYG
ncbi:MAG: M48 family peptidase [Alphaproteobacteria bacterium]|nr:MAG: M48 family peptidase [Alphaproteobacteria bacterium]